MFSQKSSVFFKKNNMFYFFRAETHPSRNGDLRKKLRPKEERKVGLCLVGI
jgi:hypothetical protein